jgi:hypothetical protein
VRPFGDILDKDDDGPGDGVHYRCMTCDVVVATPTGQIVGQARQLAPSAFAAAISGGR